MPNETCGSTKNVFHQPGAAEYDAANEEQHGGPDLCSPNGKDF